MKGYSENEIRTTGTATMTKITSGFTNERSAASHTSDTMMDTMVSMASMWNDARNVLYIVSPMGFLPLVWRNTKTNVDSREAWAMRKTQAKKASCLKISSLGG